MLLAKLNHYGIRGVLKDWFRLYLSIRNHFASINCFDSSITALNSGVRQVSQLGPSLFLVYINYLNHANKFCKTEQSRQSSLRATK